MVAEIMILAGVVIAALAVVVGAWSRNEITPSKRRQESVRALEHVSRDAKQCEREVLKESNRD